MPSRYRYIPLLMGTKTREFLDALWIIVPIGSGGALGKAVRFNIAAPVRRSTNSSAECTVICVASVSEIKLFELNLQPASCPRSEIGRENVSIAILCGVLC